MKLIHTADWHLGRLFHGVSLIDDQVYVLEQFKQLIVDEKPDAVIIAGDVYDRSLPPTDAVHLLDETLSDIVLGLKAPVFMIAGNHDSAQRLGFASGLLEARGLYVRGRGDKISSPIVFSHKEGDVDFCLLPYEVTEPLIARTLLDDSTVKSFDDAMGKVCQLAIGQCDPSHRKICISHCFAVGGVSSDSERPLSVGGSDSVSTEHFSAFDYVALGHLHRPQSVGDNGAYSGSLLKYSFSEAGHAKSISVIDMDADGAFTRREVALSVRRDVRIVEGEFAELLKGKTSEDYILARLTDTQALYDPLARLRDVYPNILQIERPGLFNEHSEGTASTKETLKRDDLELFASFYQDITDRELSAEALSVLTQTLQAIKNPETDPESASS